MKKLNLILALGALVIMTSFSNAEVGSKIEEGQKLFKKKLRKACKFSGIKFARYHTQEEWEEFHEQAKFPEEAKRICPKLDLKTIKPSWWEPIYEFTREYGEGGGHVPKC
ncbi:MAG: hypothetical protein LT067_05060 [Sulfurovum sp.]|jgi:hypothetical protein|nr:hypothetical protein [Sulfurovum sp.]